jgi:MoxR-like ATPase
MKKSLQRDDIDAAASYPCGPRLEELAAAAIRFFNEHTTLVPVLWGPSSEGKTFFSRNLARKMDALFIHVILSAMKPDDVAGCQIMTPEGELRVALPWWFRQAKETAAQGRRVVILLDELDKSDDDLFEILISLFRESLW